MKRESEHITDELIIKYLAQEHTEAEGILVDNWLAASDSNRQYMAEMQQIWGMVGQVEEKDLQQADEAWKRFQSRVATSSTPIKSLRPAPRQQWLRIAAVLLVGVACAAGIWSLLQQQTQIEQQMLVNHSSEPLRQELADGSLVHLKPGTSLYYPEAFSDGKRLVRLEGEAFFDIARDSLHPFVIETEETLIEVLGTSFLVRAIPGEEQTEVVVKTGIVTVKDKDQAASRSLILKKGMAAQHDHVEEKVVEIAAPEDPVDVWVPKVFRFSDTPMSEIADMLSEAYGLDIRFVSEEHNCTYTSPHIAQSIEQIMAIIHENEGYSTVKTATGYDIIGENCSSQ